MGVDHYENFPVASWLCPPALRPAIQAIYRFARTADDLADEGDASTDQRLAALAAYSRALQRFGGGATADTAADTVADPRWPQVFTPLAAAVKQHALPLAPLQDLLDAFEQDVRNPPYADRAALLDYARRSANPVGRLLLHLYGVDGDEARSESDAICSALQLANFWQDLGVDLARGRCYLPLQDARAHGVTLPAADGPPLRALLRDLCDWTVALMHRGAPLVHRIPGRGGWELRLVVQGGLRVLEKIARMDHATLLRRPTLGAADLPLLLWRAVRMRPTRPGVGAA